MDKSTSPLARFSGDPIEEWQFTSMPFGNAGSPAIALFQLQEQAKARKDRYPLAAESICKSTLMDDILDSFETEEKAAECAKQQQAFGEEIGMTIQKFASNSRAVLATISPEKRAKGLVDLSKEVDLPHVKTLGIVYDMEKDIFTFTPLEEREIQFLKEKGTKRTILKTYSRIYDPLGYICPAVIQAKCIFHRCWLDKKEWDDRLDDNLQKQWEEWLDSLRYMNSVNLARCLRPNPLDETALQLHCFVDASKKAYAAVTYVRCEYRNGSVSTNIVTAKSRVCPVKGITLPRAELLGAVIGTAITKEAKDPLGIPDKDIHYWTDSMNVLFWLRSQTHQLQIFVGNRVDVILSRSKLENWHWVDTLNNPADIPSRGMSLDTLITCNKWWNGPEFLQEIDTNKWPKEPEVPIGEIEGLEEVRKEYRETYQITELSFHNPPSRPTIKQKINVNFDRYSSWMKYKRIFRRLCSFIRAWIKQRRQKKDKKLIISEIKLIPEDDQAAEFLLINSAQTEAFPEEAYLLSKHGNEPSEVTRSNRVIKSNSPLYEVRAILHQGLIISESRLSGIKYLPEHMRRPIILPKDHKIT